MLKFKDSISLVTFIYSSLVVLLHALQWINLISLSPDAFIPLHFILYIVLIIFAIRRRSLTAWIFISLVIGMSFGYYFPKISVELKILSSIFLKLIKTVIAPLLFGTLVVGIAGHSNLKQVGRMGLKAIIYFEIVTTLALFIGLAAINITKAGEGAPVPQHVEVTEEIKGKKQTASDVILHVFPENIAKSVAEGQVLQIVIFSIIFGIGLAMVSVEKRQPMINFCESLSETMFKFTNIVMVFAPAAVFGASAFTIGNYGIGVIGTLIGLLATLYGALIVFVLLVFIPVMLFLKIDIRNFFRAMAEPGTLAFATASSESALPIAMENMEAIGVPRKIVSFVLPTGYSFNLDGTTLYLSLASVFVAQAAGIDLSIGQQLLMVFTLMLTSKGVAGVPRASLVILSATAASFGLPPEPIFLILGIDAFMDMARTAVNVTGNCLASVVVAKWEKEFDEKPFPTRLRERG